MRGGGGLDWRGGDFFLFIKKSFSAILNTRHKPSTFANISQLFHKNVTIYAVIMKVPEFVEVCRMGMPNAKLLRILKERELSRIYQKIISFASNS